jgi:hypothetical protein
VPFSLDTFSWASKRKYLVRQDETETKKVRINKDVFAIEANLNSPSRIHPLPVHTADLHESPTQPMIARDAYHLL